MKTLMLIFASFWLTACSHVFYQPQKRHYLDPVQLKLEYADVFFDSKDGTKLHGWIFATDHKKPKGTIVHFHGNAQNLSTHFFNLIWLVKEGYDLFIFDYRGYGKSKGEPDQKGVYQDALAGMERGHEFHQSRHTEKFIIYGQSLGGVIALRALPDFAHKDEVDLIVQDSTFSSYTNIGFNALASHWFTVPFSPLAYLLVSDEYGSHQVFEKIKTPTLVIVGQKDPIIPQKFGKEIYKNIHPSQKWLWKLPNGGHIDVFHHEQGIYRKKFLDLLESIGRV